jgi:plastocyanin
MSAAALLAVTAGCGGSGSASARAVGSTTAMPSMPPTASAGLGQSGLRPAPANSVNIANFAFAPTDLIVRVGTAVTWTNHDQDAHDVTDATGAFRSPTLNPGDSFTFTFTKPGRYSYQCTIHPFMTAIVTVTP